MSMIQLFVQDPDSKKRNPLGLITEARLRFLQSSLEEEFEEDVAFIIDQETVDYLRDQGAPADLLNLLQQALEGHQDGIEITYKRD